MKNSLTRVILIAFLLVYLVPFAYSDYNRSLINITLLEPKFGISKVDTFNLVVNVSNVSECRYSTNPTYNFSEIFSPENFFTADGYNQTIENFEYGYPQNEKDIYVLCKVDDNDYVNNGYPKKITIGVDKTPPEIIEAYADPNPLIENTGVTLHAKTDDKTVCFFGEIPTQEQQILNFFSQAKLSDFTEDNEFYFEDPQDNTNYTYGLVCQNRAGDKTSPETISFTVNKSLPNRIVEITPEGYIPSKEIDVTIKTNRDAVCYYGDNYLNTFQGEHSKNHLRQLEDLDETFYNIPIQCVFDQGKPDLKKGDVNFTIDLTKPTKPAISAPQYWCNTSNISASFSSTDEHGIKKYNYFLKDENDTIIKEGLTKKSAILGELDLTVGITYYWEVYATDLAGNNGTSAESPGTEILPSTAEYCQANNPPEVNYTKEESASEVKITLICNDDEGPCDVEYFIINSQTNESCQICGECGYRRYYVPISIKENSTICYEATDSGNKSVSSSFNVEVDLCLNLEDGCCLGEEDGVCDKDCSEEEDVDCLPENMDTDGDGMSDAFENEYGLDFEDPDDADEDEDDDLLTNYEEFDYGTNPLLKDSDGDGSSDYDEIDDGSDPNDPTDKPFDPDADSDGDGLSDIKEDSCGLDPNNPDDADEDSDDDGLINRVECYYNSDINEIDTDLDGYSDKQEYDKDTDPNDPESYPKSYFMNILLFILGLGATVAGIVLFAKNSPKTPKSEIKPSAKKPMVNFKETEKQMSKEPQPRMQKTMQQPAQQQIPTSELDQKLREKRQKLKLKKMRSVFDEFAEETEPKLRPVQKKVYAKLEKIPKKVSKENSFDRLEDISREDAFEELEIISKKDKKRKSSLTKREKEKLDKLSEK